MKKNTGEGMFRYAMRGGTKLQGAPPVISRERDAAKWASIHDTCASQEKKKGGNGSKKEPHYGEQRGKTKVARLALRSKPELEKPWAFRAIWGADLHPNSQNKEGMKTTVQVVTTVRAEDHRSRRRRGQ